MNENFTFFLNNKLRHNKKHSKASFFTIWLKELDEIWATRCLIKSDWIKYF